MQTMELRTQSDKTVLCTTTISRGEERDVVTATYQSAAAAKRVICCAIEDPAVARITLDGTVRKKLF